MQNSGQLSMKLCMKQLGGRAMEWIQLIFMGVGFLALGCYQHYRIKHLESKTKDQSDLLKDIKVFSDIINPQLIKCRVELLEQALEKEKKLEISKMQTELIKAMESHVKNLKHAIDLIGGLIQIAVPSLMGLPYERAKMIVMKCSSSEARKAIEPMLPTLKEIDRRTQNALLANMLGAGPSESSSGAIGEQLIRGLRKRSN